MPDVDMSAACKYERDKQRGFDFISEKGVYEVLFPSKIYFPEAFPAKDKRFNISAVARLPNHTEVS